MMQVKKNTCNLEILHTHKYITLYNKKKVSQENTFRGWEMKIILFLFILQNFRLLIYASKATNVFLTLAVNQKLG